MKEELEEVMNVVDQFEDLLVSGKHVGIIM